MKDQQTLWVAGIAAACFVVACVTGLSALGRDATQVLYLLSAIAAPTVASIFSARNAKQAKDSANNAVDHAVDNSVAQEHLKTQVDELRQQIGGRRASDNGTGLGGSTPSGNGPGPEGV